MSRAISAVGRGLDSSHRGVTKRPDIGIGRVKLSHDEQWRESIANSPHWSPGQIDDEANMPDDDGTWSSDHVFTTADNQLVWQAESDGDDTTDALEGTLNSASEGAASHHPSEGIPITPYSGSGGGVYMEASIQTLDHIQDGLLAGFWCMPASQSWPGEIDNMEHETSGAWVDTEDPTRTFHMTHHWATTGTCGDYSNPDFAAQINETADNLTNDFHTYGVAWYSDDGAADSDPMLQWYYDGTLVREITFGDASQATVDTLYASSCLPQGMQFSCHINRGEVTGADLTQQWLVENTCDWVRVWHLQ